MYTLREIAHILIWFPPIINFIGMSFQATKNSQLRSAEGVSSIMLMLRYLAACTQILYLFFLDLPFAYRVLIWPQWALLAYLVYQQIYYAQTRIERDSLIATTTALTLVWCWAWYAGFTGSGQMIGHVAGWLMVVLGAIVQLPQIYKNYRRKSTHGYSFGYVCYSITAYLFDWTLAIIIGVPIQTHVAYSRAILYRMVEVYQFNLYSKNNQKHS